MTGAPANGKRVGKVVWIASSPRRGARRYHVTPDCVTVLEPLAVLSRGQYSATAAGYTLCRKCAWKALGRKRPTCSFRHPDRSYKCSLIAAHQGEHYSPGGPGRPARRWPRPRDARSAAEALESTARQDSFS